MPMTCKVQRAACSMQHATCRVCPSFVLLCEKKVSQIFGSKFKQCDEESITFPAAAAVSLVAVIVIVLPMEMCPSKRNSNSHSSSNTHTKA